MSSPAPYRENFQRAVGEGLNDGRGQPCGKDRNHEQFGRKREEHERQTQKESRQHKRSPPRTTHRREVSSIVEEAPFKRAFGEYKLFAASLYNPLLMFNGLRQSLKSRAPVPISQ